MKPISNKGRGTEAHIECDEPEGTGVLRPDEVEPKVEPKEPSMGRRKRKLKLPRNSQQKLFQCDQCRCRFLTYLELQVHFDYLHMGVRRCFECKVKFSKQNDMLMHMTKFHSDDTKFVCEYCDDAFLSKEELDNHRKRCKTNSAAKQAQTPPVELPLAASLLANATKSQRQQTPRSSTASTPVTRSRAKTAMVVITPIIPPSPPPPTPPAATTTGRRRRPPWLEQFSSGDYGPSWAKVRREVKPVSEKSSPGSTPGRKNESSKASSSQLLDADSDLDVTTSPEKKPLNAESESEELLCNFCQKSFPSISALSAHHITSHPGTRFSCVICRREFETKTELSEHFQEQHTTAQGLSKCHLCPFTRRTSNLVRTHLATWHSPTIGTQCSLCPEVFFCEEALIIHERRKHSKRSFFQCNRCAAYLPSRFACIVHFRTEHKERREFKCKTCGLTFDMKKTMLKHVWKEHPDVRLFACRACPKTYKHANSLQKHVDEAHNGIVRLKCTMCSYTTSTAISYSTHLKQIHGVNTADTEKKRYGCKICGKNFHLLVTLRHHTSVAHADDQPMKCQFCSSVFSTRTDLLHHIRSTHNRRKRLECRICHRSVGHAGILKRHMRSCHPGPGEHPERKCPFCYKRFRLTSAYDRHIKQHEEGTVKKKKKKLPPPVDCDVCGLFFRTAYKRDVHVSREHHDDPTRICRGCQVNFSSKEDFKKHMDDVHNGVPLSKPPIAGTCKICGRDYFNRGALRSHMQYGHLGTKDFKCSYCPATFIQPRSLMQHERKAHTRPGLRCKRCYAFFKNPDRLRLHMLYMHENVTEFKCRFCELVFRSPRARDVHMKVVHSFSALAGFRHASKNSKGGERIDFMQTSQIDGGAFVDKDFICTYCNKPFDTHDKMQEHIATDHQSKKLFECAYCDLKFSKACDRKQHIYDCHPEKPKFVCNICSKRLITQKDFCKHRREHSEAPVQTYNCDHCTDSFTDPFHLLCHLRATHTELEIHACEYCSQLFNSDAEVQEHTKEAHAAHLAGTFTCKKCGLPLRSQWFLQVHAKTRHPQVLNPRPPAHFDCRYCNKKFVSMTHLRSHIVYSHNGRIVSADYGQVRKEVVRYVCSMCTKRMCTIASLRTHMAVIHRVRMPFPPKSIVDKEAACYDCEYCRASFALPKFLDKHMFDVHMEPCIRISASSVDETVPGPTDVVELIDSFDKIEARRKHLNFQYTNLTADHL
ncbi:hypothetical protein AAHC03_024228 [Spirometra sp. Aus1]